MTRQILANLLLAGFLALTPLSAQAQEAVPGDANPAWFGCSQASDCTVIRGFCNQPEAVNHEHAEAYGEWVRISPPVHCALMPPISKICVTCEASRCRAKTERGPTELESLIKKLSAPPPPETEPEY